jgi:SAM-dependent methyltransferase
VSASIARDVRPFDAWAASYDQHWSRKLLFGRVHRQVVREVLRSGVRPTRVLDVGSGTGELLLRLGHTFPRAELFGVDPAQGMIATAQRKAEGVDQVRFIEAGAGSLPFEAGEFELVVSTSSFHHWDDQEEGLRQVARVLAPGGIFILADGYKSRRGRMRLGILPRLLKSHEDDPDRFHRPATLRRMLETAGLPVMRQRKPMSLMGTVMLTRAKAPTAGGSRPAA